MPPSSPVALLPLLVLLSCQDAPSSTTADTSSCTEQAWYQDSDGDGFGVAETLTLACSAPSAEFVAADGDCDDMDPAIHPDAAPEQCDDIDSNCNGSGDCIGDTGTPDAEDTAETTPEEVYWDPQSDLDADGVPDAWDCDPQDPRVLEDGVAMARSLGPGLYWSFWGGQALDSSGFGRDGTIADPSVSTVVAGDISDDALHLGTSTADLVSWSSKDIPPGPFTVSLWLQTTDTIGGIFSYASTAGSDNDVLLYLDGSGGSVHRSGYWLGGLAFGDILTDGSWHHVALTWQTTGTLQVYVDGVLEHSYPYYADPLSPGGTLMLAQEQDCVGGCLDANQALDGLFDEFSIFSRALTDAEILQISAGCQTRTDTDGDGLSDAAEQVIGTDAQESDSDGDGLDDGSEVYRLQTQPLDADSDDDGVIDGEDSDP